MRSETNLVILDACRNNPLAAELARSLGLSRAMAASRGLARVEEKRGMLIAFATAEDDVADDVEGRHSPYTAALLEHIETPGLSVQELFTHVAASVNQRTGGKQQPWTNYHLLKVVRLVPEGDTPPGPQRPPLRDRETAFWESVKDSKDPADFRAYLEQFPEGTYRSLALNRLRRLGEERLAIVEAGNLRDFLGRGLSANTVGENGWTDLHYAAAVNLPEVVEALLDAGASPAARATSAEDDETSLSDAQHQFLESLGFKLNFWWGPSPDQGLTPLHIAAWGDARETTLVLLNHGGIEKKDNEGRTPLHWAAWANAQKVALLLIERGADVRAKTLSGGTPLMEAAEGNAREIALALIERGADARTKNHFGYTALHGAAVKNLGRHCWNSSRAAPKSTRSVPAEKPRSPLQRGLVPGRLPSNLLKAVPTCRQRMMMA